MENLSEMDASLPAEEMASYWQMEFPAEDILFVESAESPKFERFIAALEDAYMVGMDAEWKPVRSPLASPRVAVLQVSIRVRNGCREEGSCEENQQLHRQVRGSGELELAPDTGQAQESCTIYLLDMLALPAAAFSAPMKRMLCSRNVLKLGFGFKQDLLHLAASFPGPDARGCFDKVESYVDIGTLYRQLRGRNSLGLAKPARGLSTGKESSLSAICEAILGLPLCKDVQCSNWEMRPLSPEQVAYAAADAHCLHLIFDSLQLESQAFIEEEGRRMVRVSASASSLVGLAMLLEDANDYVTGNIFRARRGLAQEMVEEALNAFLSGGYEALRKQFSLPKYLVRIAQRFGERLLVIEDDSKRKLGRRKPRSRQARDAARRSPDDEVRLEWTGPPPWDLSVGGNGVPKFLCDVMIEGLARHLRCMGIDTAYPQTKKSDPRHLVEQAEREGRVLLTRDVKLLRRRLIPDNLTYRVKNSVKQDQLMEILTCFNISVTPDQLLSRCIKCNGTFSPRALNASEAAAGAPDHQQPLPKCVLEADLEFWQCSACRHVFWQGSQFARAMEQFTSVVCQITTRMPGDDVQEPPALSERTGSFYERLNSRRHRPP